MYASLMRALLLTIVVLASLLLFYEVSRPQTGYLHSWNQITTLAMAKGIGEEPRSWSAPKGVVTRVTWGGAGEGRNKSPDRFVLYEEFPLYHAVTALIAKFGLNLEASARTVSILSFFMAGYLLCLLVGCRPGLIESQVCLGLFLTSFPLLYYGQAIMSDMAMLAWGLLGMVCIQRKSGGGVLVRVAFAALALLVSTLFKSYSAILVIVMLFSIWRKNRGGISGRDVLLARGLLVMAVVPVIAWHVFAGFQDGHQEYVSHAVSTKLKTLLSYDLYKALLKNYFCYVGYVPGGLLLCSVLPYIRRRVPRSLRGVPAWVYSWLVGVFLYLVCTLDKLVDHSYYFLLCVPPVFFFATERLVDLHRRVSTVKSPRVADALIGIILLTNFAVSTKSMIKAKRQNADVLKCAEQIRNHTRPGELIATLTGVTRFNSMAFYSGRLAVNVEGASFPIARYVNAGATTLVLNLDPKHMSLMRGWINRELGRSRVLWSSDELKDFRGRKRSCAIYDLAKEPKRSAL